jgi:hypothetical protein
MRLRDLDAQFLKREEVVETWNRVREDGSVYAFTGPREQSHYVETLAEADGVMFLCPLCFKNSGKNDGVGVHSVICWFEDKVPDHVRPGPGRWKPQGTGLDDLTFVPGKQSCSVLLLSGCAWHGFVKNGDAT